jgi:hypothetical protein
MVGAEKPQFARAMGYKTVGTYQEAVKEAERLVGKNPKILCTPECFSGGVAVHLYQKGMADK